MLAASGNEDTWPDMAIVTIRDPGLRPEPQPQLRGHGLVFEEKGVRDLRKGQTYLRIRALLGGGWLGVQVLIFRVIENHKEEGERT